MRRQAGDADRTAGAFRHLGRLVHAPDELFASVRAECRAAGWSGQHATRREIKSIFLATINGANTSAMSRGVLGGVSFQRFPVSEREVFEEKFLPS